MSVDIFHRLDPGVAELKGRVADTVRTLLAERPEIQSVIVGRSPPSRNGYRTVRPPATTDLLYFRPNEGTNHPGRRTSPVRLQTARFAGLAPALRFATGQILPTRHSYLIHLSDGDWQDPEGYLSLQVVDRHRILGDGDTGLLAHLSFDPGCERLDTLIRLQSSGRLGEFHEYRLGGVPCFGLPLQGEPDQIAEGLESLLEEIHGRRPSSRAVATVYDEGPPKAMGQHVVARASGGLSRAIPRPPAGATRDALRTGTAMD